MARSAGSGHLGTCRTRGAASSGRKGHGGEETAWTAASSTGGKGNGGGAPPTFIPPDWPISARRYQHDLSHDSPLHCASQLQDLRPLEFDVHDGIEMGVMLAGKLGRVFADATFVAERGDVWMVPAWEPHGWQCLEPKTGSLLINFLPEFLDGETLGGIPWLNLFSIPASQRPRVASEEARARVLAIAEDLRDEIENRPIGWQDAVRHGVLRLLLVLRRDWRPPSSVALPPPIYARALERLMPAMNALRASPASRVGIPEAAAVCGLSPSRFRQVFRETVGVSFGQFCLRSRIAVVAHRLLASECSTEHIAEQAGFVDASHLHRTFVKHYHMTPADYRRRFQ